MTSTELYQSEVDDLVVTIAEWPRTLAKHFAGLGLSLTEIRKRLLVAVRRPV